MKCPGCSSSNTAVTDSRPTVDGVRRRRKCLDCYQRFTTAEVVVGMKTKASLKKLQDISKGLEAVQTVIGNLQSAVGALTSPQACRA